MAGAAALLAGQALPQYTDPQTARSFILDPASGQLLELRIPTTITERLQAQGLLGIGLTQSPVGRKASGEAPPQAEQKPDGSQTIRESKK